MFIYPAIRSTTLGKLQHLFVCVLKAPPLSPSAYGAIHSLGSAQSLPSVFSDIHCDQNAYIRQYSSCCLFTLTSGQNHLNTAGFVLNDAIK